MYSPTNYAIFYLQSFNKLCYCIIPDKVGTIASPIVTPVWHTVGSPVYNGVVVPAMSALSAMTRTCWQIVRELTMSVMLMDMWLLTRFVHVLYVDNLIFKW